MSSESKVLFLSYGLQKSRLSGGAKGSHRNLEVLRGAFPGSVVVFSLGRDVSPEYAYCDSPFPNSWFTLFFACLGFIMFRPRLFKRVAEVIRAEGVNWVYIDDSVHGRLVRFIKKNITGIRVVAFFHNIEWHYYWNLVTRGSLVWLPFFWAARWNERLTCKFADYLVGLTDRDHRTAARRYGRGFDFLSPVSLIDEYRSQTGTVSSAADQDSSVKLLFVGAFFPPNVDGIRWFVANVLPALSDVRLFVVGSGMESLRGEFADQPKVSVLGRVEDLAEVYACCHAVVAPLFAGAGQKIKVAEALMFGKTVFGTAEAFEGYQFDRNLIGAECNSADEFIKVLSRPIPSRFNAHARQYYLDNHTNEAQIRRMRDDFWGRIESV